MSGSWPRTGMHSSTRQLCTALTRAEDFARRRHQSRQGATSDAAAAQAAATAVTRRRTRGAPWRTRRRSAPWAAQPAGARCPRTTGATRAPAAPRCISPAHASQGCVRRACSNRQPSPETPCAPGPMSMQPTMAAQEQALMRQACAHTIAKPKPTPSNAPRARTSSESVLSTLTARRAHLSTTPNHGAYFACGLPAPRATSANAVASTVGRAGCGAATRASRRGARAVACGAAERACSVRLAARP
jgi:hypothetical protein